MVLTFVLQKRRRIDSDSDAEELERMMAVVGEGFNPKRESRAGSPS